MSTRSLLAVAALVALTGCGTGSTSAQPSAPASPAAEQDRKQQIQAIKADCMKGKGFKYVPFTRPSVEETEEEKKLAAGDYATMRSHRAKYGFGVSARLVHPDLGHGKEEFAEDPNYAIRDALSPAQRTAYSKASDTCEAQAVKQVTGEVVSNISDWHQKQNIAFNRALTRELDGDPELVKLAATTADCMRSRGHQMSSAKPRDVARWGWITFKRELHELAQKNDKNGDIPDFDPDSGTGYLPTNLAPAEKRQILNREIKAALDDLECGKEFRTAHLPKEVEIAARFDG